MIKIALHGAEFFAFHGFYPQEQQLGNSYLVDIDVSFEPSGDLIDDKIAHTVNYEDLYEIACAEMQQPKKLIETVAQGILDQVKTKYPNVERIEVSIKKLNPPLGCKVAYSNVVINYSKA
ncbi:MAG: dihydroneopterin aldolase [Mucilaginibacter sp.]